MKITKSQLKQIIKEELESVVQEEPLLENENPFDMLYDQVYKAQQTLIKLKKLAVQYNAQIGPIPTRDGEPKNAAGYVSSAWAELNHLARFLMEKSM